MPAFRLYRVRPTLKPVCLVETRGGHISIGHVVQPDPAIDALHNADDNT
jgi:hypothetical protein